jgi:hypothetical protein
MPSKLQRILDNAGDTLKTTGKVLAIGAGTSLVTAGLIILGASVGSAVGAIGGEILDHIPYLKKAIPDGIGYLTNYINPDATVNAQAALYGNLDKIGAAMGFIGGFYRSSISYKKEKKHILELREGEEIRLKKE